MSHVTHTRMSHGTLMTESYRSFMNAPCRTYARVMSHIGMSQVALINESRRIYTMSHVAHMNESRRTYK